MWWLTVKITVGPFLVSFFSNFGLWIPSGFAQFVIFTLQIMIMETIHVNAYRM